MTHITSNHHTQETKTVAVDKSREQEATRTRSRHPSDGESLEIFGPVTKFVDKAVADQYSGLKPNYHNDLEAASDLGFPDIVVQGTLSLSYICELLTKRFGAGLFVGGRLDREDNVFMGNLRFHILKIQVDMFEK